MLRRSLLISRVLSFRVLGFSVLGFSVLGCSWTRFDDVTENAPVAMLKKPGKLGGGFGVSLATASTDEQVLLMSTGSALASPGAVFSLGIGDQPTKDAVDTGACDNSLDPCATTGSIAALTKAQAGRDLKDLCFVFGVGRAGDQEGLIGRCSDTVEYGLPVPPEVRDFGLDPLFIGDPLEVVYVAADNASAPFLLGGFPFDKVAWFYTPEKVIPPNGTPQTLVPPPPLDDPEQRDESYGATLASVRIGGDGKARVFAVGAPAKNHVWLFKTDDQGENAFPVGCLGGPAGFGRTLASGPVNTDDADELLVADDVNVTAFSGAALAVLPETRSTTCSLGALPAGGIVESFSCGSNSSTRGCDQSGFGAALAVADLDADGDGEIIVGAPGMVVRGEDRAGAVLVFDVEGERPWEFDEINFLSSAEAGDELGKSLAAPMLEGGRQVIAAGAPGHGKTALFYCSTLLPAELRGSRCE